MMKPLLSISFPSFVSCISGWFIVCLLLMGFSQSVNAAVPTVSTRTANSITRISATLRGTVVTTGGANTTASFDYSIDSSYSSSVIATPDPVTANNTNVSAPISGLLCASTYNFRIKGHNSFGDSSYATGTFTTSACVLPTATTNAATAIVASGATVNGTVTANGSNSTVSFNYGTTTSYGSSITATQSPLDASASNAAVSANLTGLACNTLYHFRVTATNAVGTRNGTDVTFTTLTCPTVTAISMASNNPTAANTVVSWNVVFNTSVTGVNSADFALVQAGGVTGATISSVTGSGASYTVTANTGTGTVGTLKLNLVDDDSITNGTTPLGGAGTGNGNFGGETYTLIVPVCNSSMLFCDDFERSVGVGGSNTAGAVGTASGYGTWTVSPLSGTCAGTTGNAGCAGIDSDLPPWSTAASPRANSTRAAFTRWSNVIVTSPVIDLSSLPSRSKTAQISFWLRRGSDCFSEWPGDNQAGCNAALTPRTAKTGEEFRIEYKNNAETWVTLAQYPTEAAPGEIVTPVIDLPDDALWSGFQLRFQQPNGSGSSGSAGANNVVGYDYWHFDNVIVSEHPVTNYTGAFCDTFEGDLSRWTMTGVGNVQIGSAYFQNGAHDMDLRWNTVSATTKATDMSNTTGDITFWVKRGTGAVVGGSYPNTTGSDFPETNKNLQIDYFSNNNTWVTLTTFAGGGTAGQAYPPTTLASAIGTANATKFTLPANAKHSKFKFRFTLTSSSGVYDLDYWHVDDVCIGAIVQAADLSLTKSSSGSFTPGQYVTYTLTVANAGPNIEPGAISIVDTLPTGLSYQSGSAGWLCSAAGQVVTCTRSGALAVGGSDSVTITATVDSTIIAGTITNSATVGGQSLDANLANNTATKTDTVVVPSYVFTDKVCSIGTALGTGAQCNLIDWSPQIAGQTLNSIYITAVNGLGIPTELSNSSATTVNMQFALSCHNPSTSAGVAASFSAASSALPTCTANGAIPGIWTAATALSFPAASASVGAYDFNYADVGSVELFMRNSAVTTQIGKSGAFVVKPYGLLLSAISATNNSSGRCTVAPDSSPACANIATDAAVFAKAGEVFSVTVKATTQSGAAAPNFGNEQSPETVRLNSTLSAPAGGNNPAISGSFARFNNGIATGTAFSWAEVGIITLTPSIGDGDYLGIGDIIGTTSGNIGRFYPDHFTVTATHGAMNPFCAGFTYTGQTMSYATVPSLTIKAMNALAIPTVTTNYTGSFQKLSSANIAITTPSTDSSQNGKDGITKTTLNAAVSTGTLSNNNGVMTYTLNSADSYTYIRNSNAWIAPYLSDISLSVTAIAEPSLDSVTATGTLPILKPTGVSINYGRISLQNSYGSELLDLAMPLKAQYWNGNAWITNSNDLCTTGVSLSLTDVNATDGLITSELCAWDTGSPGNSGLGCSAAGTLAKQYSEPPIAGNFNLNWKAPGNGNTGFLNVTATVPSYLQFNWRGAGNANPTARATFGVYKGKDKQIYFRELY